MCGIEITVRDSQWTIRGDQQDPFSRGHICPKAVALQDIYLDPDRLRHPVRRNGNDWEQIGWDEALDETANRLREIRDQQGKNSIGFYQGNPTVHNYGSLLFGPRFVRTLRTRNRFSATSVDQLSHHFAAYFQFGHQLLIPIPDIDHTNFLLMLGANPVVSNGSLMTAPDAANRLKAIQKRGGTIVVIDPRRSETAQMADRHHFIRPGTDALLLLALLHVMFAENMVRPGRLEPWIDGMETLRQAVANYSPSSVGDLTGIAAEEIARLAREFAASSSAACYGRIGVSTQEFGGLCQWLINTINIVTGNLDRVGGVLFTKPAFDVVNAPKSLAPPGHFDRWRSRVRGFPEFGGELPVALLAEEILTEGPDRIHALVTSSGNPILSTPNGKQLEEAFRRLDFMVSIDFYINETTRHANIILPPVSPLEREHYDLAFHFLAVRNTAKFSPPFVAPPNDAKQDWEIYLELEKRLGSRNRKDRWIRNIFGRLGPEGLLNLGLRFGPYGSKIPWNGGLSLKKLRQAPHGIDLGPLQPSLPGRMKGRRIQLAPDIFLQDLQRLDQKFSTKDDAISFRLIGRRQLRSNNSWMHNSERLVKGPEQCTLKIHPEDAHRIGVGDKQKVRVTSRTGTVEVRIEFTEEMMPGVVSLPHGWGHNRQGVRLQVAQKHAGESINDLTDDHALDMLCGTAAFNGTLVQIDKL